MPKMVVENKDVVKFDNGLEVTLRGPRASGKTRCAEIIIQFMESEFEVKATYHADAMNRKI